MPFDVFLALVVFASVMAFTPGPNNILLTASGVNFGFARTIPHLLGVDVGFVILLAVFAGGLGLVLPRVPALQLALKSCRCGSICCGSPGRWRARGRLGRRARRNHWASR